MEKNRRLSFCFFACISCAVRHSMLRRLLCSSSSRAAPALAHLGRGAGAVAAGRSDRRRGERSREPLLHDEVVALLRPALEGAPQPPGGKAAELASALERLERHRQSDLAWRLYEQLRLRGTQLDAASYAGFVRAVGNVSEPRMAERALQIEADMRTEGKHDPNDPSLASALMRAAAAAGDFGRAEASFAEQRSAAEASGSPVARATLVDFLAACARAGEARRAVEVYEEHVGAEGAPRLPKALGAAVNACARGGDLEGALRIYREGVAAGVRPNTVLLNALLVGFARQEPPDATRALELYRDMCGPLYGVVPDAATVKMLVGACTRAGDAAGAIALFDEARARGVQACLEPS